MTTGTTRIMLVDDHMVVRRGLRALFDEESDIEVVAEAADAEDAVARALAVRPDVILMDIRLGEGDASGGIDACREILSELPDTRVLMFSSFGERQSVLASVLAGAAGFLTKNVSHRRLLEALRAVARGESVLESSVTRDVLEQLSSLSSSAPESSAPDALSERERDVLRLVALGRTNKEIATELSISPYTARNHVTHILEKLSVSRRSEAAVEAVRLGLLDDAERTDQD